MITVTYFEFFLIATLSHLAFDLLVYLFKRLDFWMDRTRLR